MNYIARQARIPASHIAKKNVSLPPIFVVLHGYGTDEYDLLPIAEKISGGRFLIISLQGPIGLSHGGHAWYDLLQTPDGIIPDDISRHVSEELLLAGLPGIIEREKGDASRVVLMGFSQGAAMIYGLLAAYDLTAPLPAAVPQSNHSAYQGERQMQVIASINMSGYLPRDIFEALSQRNLNGFPLYMCHGEYDDLIPAKALGEASEWLTKQGAKVTAKMYPVGHGVLPDTVEEISEWLKNLRI